MHGILLVDKPEGVTSNDVVRTVKRIVKPAKVGHSGTLDPAASGLMIILIGSGTRTLDYLNENRKSYRLLIRLGEETDTDDRDGTVIRTADPSGIGLDTIEDVLKRYRGVIYQVPPHYSAIKREGVPLYKLARKGVFPELSPRKVEIFILAVIRYEGPFLELEMMCSRGTYARSVARDIGRDLGVWGRLENLRRNACGDFRIEDALTLDQIPAGGRDAISTNLITLRAALSHIPDIEVSLSEIGRLIQGNSITLQRSRLPQPVPFANLSQRLFKVVPRTGDLLILVRPEPKASEIVICPIRVLDMRDDKPKD